MKTFRFVIVLLCCVSAGLFAQDLRSSWERIQAEFLGGMHDSVVVHVAPFLQELKERNLSSQLSVGYFHLAVSLAHLGREQESDTAFAQAKQYALNANEPARVAEIETKQAQLYIGLARQQESVSSARAVRLYEKAIRTVGSSGDGKTQAHLLHQVGQLKRSVDPAGAIQAFEASFEITDRLEGEQSLRSALITALNELYLNAGETAKAEALARRTGSDRSRVEYAIKLAEEAEANGRFEDADRFLVTVQDKLIAGGEESRIVEFAKKRYSLYERLGFARRAYDTLSAILRAVQSSSAGVRFHISRFVALLAVRNGNVEEGAKLLADMRTLATTTSLVPFLDQTAGDIAYLRGDNAQAIADYRRALVRSDVFDEASRMSMLNNLGLALTRNGEHREALRVFNELYDRAGSSPPFRIQADLNAGIVLMKTDETSEAVERFKRARGNAIAHADVGLQVMASLRLAESYRRTGLETSAETLFEEVRRDQAKLTNPFNRIQVLQALATNAQLTGNKYTALLNLKQAYQLATQSGASGFLATLAVDLGDTYFLVDSLESARKLYDTALSFYAGTRDLRAQVELRYKKGQCLLAESNYDAARSETNRALSALKATPEGAESDLVGLGYATLAFVDFTEGKTRKDIRKLLTAMEEIEQAVAVMERRMGGAIGQSQLESESLQNVNAFRLYVDIAARLFEATKDPRYFELAFNTSEKSRAEAFVTDIGTQLITKLNDPSVKDLASVTEQLLENRSPSGALAVDFTSGGRTRGITATGGGDEQTIKKYDNIVRKLSAENNKAAQLVSVNTLTLSSVRGLLRDQEVMLNYYVSLDNAYLFLVTKNQQVMRTISWKPEDLAATVEAYRSAVHDLARADYMLFARQLYDWLIAPVASIIEGKTIIVVPSARLNNLPFAGLHSGSAYLVESNDLVVIPNASTLQFVSTEKKLPATPSVLAIGNPANPRVTRLPGSEQEVKSIQNIHLRSLVYVGLDASETNSRAQMGGFDIVHLACHGLFNYDYPYLSSLALSPDSRNDGFLEVHELYNLNLTKTNLVILSACETGLAKIRKNDDVIGLVRGFLYAGVPSMAASLWKVDDFATSTLMSQFHLLLKLGNSKSEALQKAQLQLLRSASTHHPYYWAAFVMYGSAR